MSKKRRTTVEELPAWIATKFQEAKAKHDEEPIGVMVFVFTESEYGTAVSAHNKVFYEKNIGDPIRSRDAVLALEDAAFRIRFNIALAASRKK